MSVARWARTQRTDASSLLELHALDATGSQLVTSWTAAEAFSDLDAWAQLVADLATDDAQARAQTMRYELRHRREDRTVGVTHLRRVIAQNVDDGAALDGSQLGLVAQLQRALHQAHAQLLDASRASIQAQQASMVLLGQAYQHIANLQSASVEQHAHIVATKEEERRPDMVRELLEVVGPHVASEVAKRMLGAPDTNVPS